MSHAPATFRHLVVSAYPTSKSFGGVVLHTYVGAVEKCRQKVDVRDLYAMAFNPVLKASERPSHGKWTPAPDVATELELLRRADVLVLLYPIWFGLPPAMLKGYVDRVLGANYAYDDLRDRTGQPALRGKPLVSVSTSAMSLDWLAEQSQVMSLREIFDVYLWRGFAMRQSEHVMLDSVVPNMCPRDVEYRLEQVRGVATRTCAMLAGLPAHARFEA